MTTIKNVAVIGGGGNLGTAVVHALLSAGFTVTVLSRIDSTTTFPSAVRVQKTDYTPSSLAGAFKDQDAVVSTIATAALAVQKDAVDAAVKAGVKHFIPSEFGINTQRVQGPIRNILGHKLQLQELLNKYAAEKEGFSWTGISNGFFFDWGMRVGFSNFSVKEKKAAIWDSGDEPFTASNLPNIGLAIALVLKNPVPFAGRYIDIASFLTTQNEILKILEEESGTKWTVEKKKTQDSFDSGTEKLAKGDYSAFSDFLKAAIWKDGEGCSPKAEELANDELGLPFEDLRATLKGALAGEVATEPYALKK